MGLGEQEPEEGKEKEVVDEGEEMIEDEEEEKE